MEDKEKIRDYFVHLARIALSNRQQDVQAYLRQIAKKSEDPMLADAVIELLSKHPTLSSPLRRKDEFPLPVDNDSRFHLLRIEEEIELPHEPIYAKEVQDILARLVKERGHLKALAKANLDPTRTILFTGPPGVGKTLAARWVARELKRPLLILDLSAVMSSYLGRTGSNLRYVLDYAKSIDGILLLDELDAIAKRRDDVTEIGELKRLVTVLLQQLDDWPAGSMLIAATNHTDLLDPAIWRRFEEHIEFKIPEREAAKSFISALLPNNGSASDNLSEILSFAFTLSDSSFSDIERKINGANRSAALNGKGIDEYLFDSFASNEIPKAKRTRLAAQLIQSGLVSQRRAHEITGIARETIRKNTTRSTQKSAR